MASEEVGQREKKMQCGYNVGWKQKVRTENLYVVTIITNTIDMSLRKLQGLVMDREAWHAAIHGVTKSWT